MFANVQDDYNLRIIDFGLAEQLEENTDHVVTIYQYLPGDTKYSPGSFESLITFLIVLIIMI